MKNNTRVGVLLRFLIFVLVLSLLTGVLVGVGRYVSPPVEAVQPLPSSSPVTIVLDAGHGGEDGGAVGVTGVYEKNLNLEITLILRDLLVEAEYNFTKEALPHYSKIAHKSGFNQFSHCDAAIVYGESSTREIKPNNYVLSVLSAVNDFDPEPNKALIAELTQIADDVMCSYQNY